MGIFSGSSQFDQDIERATSENNTSEEWGLIMEICDRAASTPANAKECLRAVLRRLAHPDPHVQVHAVTLLDACVANCGRAFHLEVASRDFETEFRRLMSRAQAPVAARMRAMLRKWAEGEFRDDPQLDLIPALYGRLRAEETSSITNTVSSGAGASAAGGTSAAAQRERDELARAIALSLRDAPVPAAGATTTTSVSNALYPRVEPDVSTTHTPTPAPAPAAARRVRALYDFEAAEDNELTFLAGETVHVTDSSDPNWWKGYNERGEGLFPANFVAEESAAPEMLPAEQQQQTVMHQDMTCGAGAAERPPDCIDEEALEEALALLHEADPSVAGNAEEESRLSRLEARAHATGALVDAALERADTRHARLTQLSAELVDALNLYHSLMRDPVKPLVYQAPPHPPPHAAPPHLMYGAPHPPRC